MQIVIDIEEDDYNFIQTSDFANSAITERLYYAVSRGEIVNEKLIGKWIEDKYLSNSWECSKCGEILNWRSNFCPNCGAKMEV